MAYDLRLNFSVVGAPGNAPIGILGFQPPSPATVPATNPNPLNANYARQESATNNYQQLGGVPYRYEIGQYEITAEQYVAFLNKVDPLGRNPVQPWSGTKLWVDSFSPVNNPFSGQINRIENARPGEHYQLAAEFWRNKPLVNGNMFHLAYFANSLFNGATLAVDRSSQLSPLGFAVDLNTRFVELSAEIHDGMYNLEDYLYPFFHRQSIYGYALPSQNEWIKAAYFAPQTTDNGTNYYYFPTLSNQEPTPLTTTANSSGAATVDELGRVIAANLQPGVSYSNTAKQVFWQPPYAPGTATSANVVDVGASATPSAWLTFDQGGNVVEYTDTAVPVVAGPGNNPNNLPVFVKVHGGIADAEIYQLWLTSTGTSSPYGQDLGATNTQGGGRFSFLANPDQDPLIGPSAGLKPSSFFDVPAGFAPVYRQDSLTSFDTFYTANISEAITTDQAPGTSYVFLGASFDQTADAAAAKAVYRFYYQPTGTHFYTINAAEASLVKQMAGYSYEGIGFTAFDPGVGQTDFRRFYNANTQAHAFSAAAADVEFFTSRGYSIEGNAWSAVL